MATLFGMFPFLKTLFADGGYQGPQFAKALAKVLPHLDVEIVKRSNRVSGFVVNRIPEGPNQPLLCECPHIPAMSAPEAQRKTFAKRRETGKE
jgi:hypothetical protein